MNPLRIIPGSGNYEKQEAKLRVRMPDGRTAVMNESIADIYARRPGHTVLLIDPPGVLGDDLSDTETKEETNGDEN